MYQGIQTAAPPQKMRRPAVGKAAMNTARIPTASTARKHPAASLLGINATARADPCAAASDSGFVSHSERSTYATPQGASTVVRDWTRRYRSEHTQRAVRIRLGRL